MYNHFVQDINEIIHEIETTKKWFLTVMQDDQESTQEVSCIINRTIEYVVIKHL